MPTLPVAPVTTILMPVPLLTIRSSRPRRSSEMTEYPGRADCTWAADRTWAEESPGRTGESRPGRLKAWARMAVASRRKAPQGFSRTIVPVGGW
ncbi:putative uncharacterized protein [Streptomyces azureus]|uniref:Uncharacterized protein n=1 Tax=Streptomyces azureus TaxID=146537 RepID=A0A0K8PWG9_STRAJ|nr:putative uncharacterized protein [Streptomyces azureus]